jgi:hypothetical protein
MLTCTHGLLDSRRSILGNRPAVPDVGLLVERPVDDHQDPATLAPEVEGVARPALRHELLTGVERLHLERVGEHLPDIVGEEGFDR